MPLIHRFNSTLVQLQESESNRQSADGGVSIPRWCNYKEELRATSILQQICFNSTLVQLQALLNLLCKSRRIDVSIPRWCNYKPWLTPIFRAAVRVSIPRWCNYKQWIFLFVAFSTCVSIPRWCNYKLQAPERNIAAIYCVSIPRWCNYKLAVQHRSQASCRVSIPRWCNYKKVKAKMLRWFK